MPADSFVGFWSVLVRSKSCQSPPSPSRQNVGCNAARARWKMAVKPDCYKQTT
ncbi:MAG: hypothetical protein FWH18_06350 [Marinilabiliaceae bacterium]|nr:hypothetical protein [Marinilabiliaceae bacterium]